MGLHEEWQRLICEKKIKYSSEGKATKALREMEWRKGAAVKFLRPYRCPVCSSYHLGNRRGSKEKVNEEPPSLPSSP